MIQRIKLKNFRRYRDETFNFGDGITVINGKNGVGKSTIIEAIEWGFYNKTKKESLLTRIRNKNAPNEEVEVKINFTFDNKEYELTRTLTAKNSTTAVITDTHDKEKIYAKGTTGVNAFITSLFGISHQAFMTSFIAPQKEIDALSSFKSEERKQFFIKLLGLQVLDKIKPEVRKDLRSSKETYTLLKNQLPEISELQEEIKNIEKEIKRKEKEKNTIFQEIEKIGVLLQKSKEKKEKLEESYKRYLYLLEQEKTLNQNINGLKDRHQNNEKIINELRPLEKEKTDIKSLEEDIHLLEKQRDDYRRITQYQDAIKETGQKVKAIENDIASKIKVKKELEASLPEEIKEIDECFNLIMKKNNLLTQIKTQINISKEEQNKMNDLLNNIKNNIITKCPTCYSDFKNNAESVEHIQKEQKRISAKIISLDFQIEELVQEITQSQQHLESLQKKKTEYDEIKSKINTLNILIENMNNNLIDAKKMFVSAEEKVSGIDTSNFKFKNLFDTEQELTAVKRKRDNLMGIIEKINELNRRKEDQEKTKTELTDNETRLSENKTEQKNLGFREEEYRKTISQTEEYSEMLYKKKEESVQCKADLKIFTNNKTTKEEEVQKAQKIKKDIEQYKENIDVLSTTDEIMTLLRLSLSGRIIPKLGEYTSNYLRDITDGMYQNVILDDNYNIKIVMDNDEWPLAEFSGGEQDIVNLCMRLAISQIILEAKSVPYNMMILDEIFGSQDDDRKMAIIDVVGRLKKIFPQIILITHINEVKDKADYIINIEKDTNDDSYISD